MTGPHVFTVGGVIRRSADILARHAASFTLAALLLVALPMLLTSGGSTMGPGDADMATAGRSWSVSGGGGLLGFLPQILLEGFVIATAFADMRGEQPDARAALRAAVAVYLPMLGLTVLSALAIFSCYLLLIVPGIMLQCAWCVVVPAFVAERPDMLAAFGRSRQITAGHRWRIFGLGLLYMLGFGLAFFLGSGLFLASFGTSGAGLGALRLLSVALSTIVTLVGQVGITAIYIELRGVEDQAGPAT